MRMPARVQMLDTLHVIGDTHLFGILRTRKDKLTSRFRGGNIQKPCVNLGLTIGRICAHVTQIAKVALSRVPATVKLFIEAAIQRQRSLGIESMFQLLQKRTTSE